MKYFKAALFFLVISLATSACQQEEIIQPEVKFTESDTTLIENEDDDDIDPDENSNN